MNEPQPFPTIPAVKPQTGLSVASLVLGILSFGCGFITGIPAIITGHIAHARAKKQPQLHGGAGMALTGLILGYVGTIFATLALIAILAGLLLPMLAKAKGRAQTSVCVSNMKQIGLAARIWSNDHNDMYPPDILTMSNELVSPKILVCPDDKSKSVAADWSQFNASQNVTYEFLTPGAKEGDVLSQTAFRCPIHNNIGLGDGSVQQGSGSRRR